MSLRIVFMGTPEFAVPSLRCLFDAGYDIVAVVTAPDKPAGRGLKLTESAVKKFAQEKGLKILQPEKLKDPVFIETLRSLQAELNVVVAFRMLPEMVWNMPPLGTINLHASLLPHYRGAAPINWAIINGEKMTGLTTFRLQHEIDTGNILLQKEIPITENDTAGTLHDKMMDAGACLLLQTIDGIAANTLSEISQRDLPGADNLQHAPKIFTDTCEIDWNQTVDKIYNHVRGLSPYPAAFTFLKGKKMKVFSAEKEHAPIAEKPGEWKTDNKTYLKFVARDGYIHIKTLQPEGKRKMIVEDFLRGWR